MTPTTTSQPSSSSQTDKDTNHSSQPHSGTGLTRKISRVWSGLPYLKKELMREISIRTNLPWATPSTYYVMCTLRCNYRCICCPQTEGRTANSPQMARETMMRIIRESKELSGSGYNISVAGGEPLVYPPIYEALELSHQLGVNMGITTNGYLLTKETIARIVAADPFNINISIESVDPAINQQLRPSSDGTERVLKAIDLLVAEKEKRGARFGIFIKPTVTEVNYRALPQMVRYFGKSGPVQINPQNYYLIKGGEKFWIQNIEEFAQVMEELVSLRNEGYSLVPPPETLREMVGYFRSPPAAAVIHKEEPPKDCTIGFRNMFFYPDGTAYFCEPMGTIGNVTDKSLREVWFGPEAQKQRRKALACRINCQMTCRRSTALLSKARAFLKMDAGGSH